jgi:hypothetical protein
MNIILKRRGQGKYFETSRRSKSNCVKNKLLTSDGKKYCVEFLQSDVFVLGK